MHEIKTTEVIHITQHQKKLKSDTTIFGGVPDTIIVDRATVAV
jgi:hypothetical protein